MAKGTELNSPETMGTTNKFISSLRFYVVEPNWTLAAQTTCISNATNAVYAVETQNKRQGTFCF